MHPKAFPTQQSSENDTQLQQLEVLHDLNGASHFSRLDLRQSFLQILLAPESHHMTTFSTQLGIKKFTRIVSGLSSALQGIPRVKNITDDIIIFGSTQEDHDNTLPAVFEQVREKGLTLI